MSGCSFAPDKAGNACIIPERNEEILPKTVFFGSAHRKVEMDEKKCYTVKGRVSRFRKIATQCDRGGFSSGETIGEYCLFEICGRCGESGIAQ